MGLPRWRGARADLLREVAASHGCGKSGAAELSKQLGEHVSADAMAGGLARIRTRGHEAGGKIPDVPRETKQPESFKGPAAPAVHTRRSENYLVISDAQIPFHKQGAVEFIERVRREFSVPLDNMLCAGDETDSYFGSRFEKTPDATYTPNGEIEAALGELRRWYAKWPMMKVASSNHGMRWAKRALSAQIPSQLLRGYREVLQAPDGWQWADSWRIQASRAPFMLEHGHNGPQGWAGLRNRALQNGVSTAFGHQHANAGVAHVVTAGQRVWSMCVGSLIDAETYAFEYDRGNTFKPWIGLGVVLDGGRIPCLVPYA